MSCIFCRCRRDFSGLIPREVSTLESRLAEVSEKVGEAAVRSGRSVDSVTVVAVSKGFDVEAIRDAIEAGQVDFGENRVQEAMSKVAELGIEGLRWHFVGRLQRNKVKQLIGWAHLIHSVDRVELAGEIARRAKRQKVLIEVNTTDDPNKGGVDPNGLIPLAEEVAGMDQLELVGLMTMAPLSAVEEEARPYFRRLAGLLEDLQARIPLPMIQHLSMGMSQDYATAVEEGSTMVRVGEAIFGPRRP